ncbi:unnamed protein product [Caenorhabditis bovis]|uniref:SSD domain-containing protein n=1 Tax=Caenorhabditis bovis TaxID=2654633 RepID=A0A8S1E545_9PELO|nr:unnamed protein product [Caenorhabditis bovis]
MRLCTAKYEHYMEKFFFNLGLSIGKNPKKYIGVLCIITAISCFGFYDFTSHTESKMFFDFLQQNGTLHMIEVLIRAKDGQSLLRLEHLKQLSALTREIVTNLTDTNGTNLTYSDMCEPYCEKNSAFYTILNIFETTDSNSSSIEITYPTTEILGRQILVANNLFNITTEGPSNKIVAFNSVVLRYYLTHSTEKPMIAFEDKLVNLHYDSNKYPLLEGQAGSDNLVAKEVRRLGATTAPYLGISLVLLCIFLSLCSLKYRRRDSKPIEACLGALIPVLSGITTIGMVSATGLAFQSIIVSTLFLVLAIGIDDVFVILAAWHRTDKSLDIPERIAYTVKEAGCSMTVTTITNLVSFGNGVLSTTPVLQTFAIYSSVASVVCYIYQLIIFPAIIAITAPREYQIEDEKKSCLPEEFYIVGKMSAVADVIWKKLAVIVGSSWMRILTISILIGYWYLAAFGVYTMETDLSIQKMAYKDARIVKFKDDMDVTLKEMQSVAVLVHNPQDLRDPSTLGRLKNLIYDFETATYSFGESSTICWLQPYLDFLNFYTDSEEEDAVSTHFNFTYKDIPSFLSSQTYFKPMLRINEEKCSANVPECVESFIFTTGFTTVVK